MFAHPTKGTPSRDRARTAPAAPTGRQQQTTGRVPHIARILGNAALSAMAEDQANAGSHAMGTGQAKVASDAIGTDDARAAAPSVAAPSVAAPNVAAPDVTAAFWRGGPRTAAAAVRGAHGGGRPLPADLAARASAHLGAPLDHVRLHDDAFAREAAVGVQANAFTVGDHVFFGAGMLETHSSSGRFRLLHEIVHTLQQRRPNNASGDPEALDRDADRVTVAGAAALPDMLGSGPILVREPTYPRRTTSSQMLREVDRVLGQVRDVYAVDDTLRMWSRVTTNFVPDVTCGVLARRVWTSIFLRHFTEPASRPGVESAHPRYFYSRDYGWIDGQHFFGFIDFAESAVRTADSRQGGLDAATAQGTQIERDQQRVKDYIILGAPPARDVTRLMQVRPPNTPLFVLPRAAAGTATQFGANVVADLTLSGAQGELFAQLDAGQRMKFWTDSARSAWSYEDIVSNQLGTRFFLEHGEAINALPAADRAAAFRSRLGTFFQAIDVVADQATLDVLAHDLPGQERYDPPTMDEAHARRAHPELFTLPN